ncbi:MAG: hypothetical protein MH321_03215 [Leptospiraceae bacterium]|nr:hypothetical protein [Leptospiraceae bacterium]
MENDLIHSLTISFEGHAQNTDNNMEYWLTRDLRYLLGYTKWDNFLNVISKARTACEISGHEIQDHFAAVGKMVDLGSGSKREIPDIRLLADFAPTVILKVKCFTTKIAIHNYFRGIFSQETEHCIQLL